ncbi:MAG: 6-carboxytetrahydropterin synthase [Chthonomonas sp.]|nr:6-carboxytetrahydropterin synthase [Chthonomonas sp.]
MLTDRSQATVTLARRVTFSCGHRYWLADRTPEENRTLFGLYASPFSHGHNYALEASFAGQIDPVTGMVINIKDLDAILHERVLGSMDLRSLNDEVEYFRDHCPTVENILAYIRSQLQQLPPAVRLTRLKLEETPLLYGELYCDEFKDMLTITRIYEFAASHRLHSDQLTQAQNDELFGKCNNPMGHGHNYVLEVTVGGEPNPTTGMIVDITALDHVVNTEIVDRYDHKNLNADLPEFHGLVPTSEVVAHHIFKALQNSVPAKLVRVRLHETARNIFEISVGA